MQSTSDAEAFDFRLPMITVIPDASFELIPRITGSPVIAPPKLHVTV
jgi:hypothetical protein